MKLLYLYLKTWPERGITEKKPIEVNFDCGYKFHCDSETHTLSCTRGNELPEGFFSVSTKGGCVDSVSVIIGDNGSGKTTIAAVLGRLFQRGRHLPEYICIYKQEERLIIYYHFEGEKKPDYSSIEGTWGNAEDDAEYADVVAHNRPFDIIYYSPYFTNNEIWSGEVMADKAEIVNLPLHDISTTYLMLHPKTSNGDIDRINAFRFEEQERILLFAHEYVNTFGKKNADKQGPVLPLPIYAQFIVNLIDLTQFKLGKLDSNQAEYDRSIREVIYNANVNNPVWKLVSTILIRISSPKISLEQREKLEQYKTVLKNICKKIKMMPVRPLNQLQFNKREKEKMRKEYEMLEKYIKDSDCPICLKDVLSPMVIIYKKQVLNASSDKYVLNGQINISDSDDFDCVLDVIRHIHRLESWLARVSGHHEPLMNVELANMSSGEMAYWTLFARLYDVIKNKMPEEDTRDILLFLDESETTLHPRWQQQLVRNVIWFLEKYVNEKAKDFQTKRHVHVIFATHSPMILSDIPMGNVAFLTSKADVEKLQSEMKDTFGADIFNLYRHPFLLSSGTVAAFAQVKIDRALKNVAEVIRKKVENVDTRVKITDETRQTLALVGDQVIRHWFKDLEHGGLV